MIVEYIYMHVKILSEIAKHSRKLKNKGLKNSFHCYLYFNDMIAARFGIDGILHR